MPVRMMTPRRQGGIESGEKAKRRILDRYYEYLVRKLLDQGMRS
jgi:hypothetical protein